MFHTLLFCWCCLTGVFGESVSVMEGDSVTLNTDLTEMREYSSILWKYGSKKALIIECSRLFGIFTHNYTDERFRDRLKIDDQTGSLTITNISTPHAGDYEVEISGIKVSSKEFSLKNINHRVSVYARLPVPNITRDFSENLSSSSSSNCSLLCSAVNVGHVTLSWYKGNSLLSSISVSDLSISLSLPLEVEHQDKNTYSCVINNPIRNQTTHLDVCELCLSCPDRGLPLLYIALISGSLLIVAAVVMYCICKKCGKTDKEVQTCEEMITYAEPTIYKRNAPANVKNEDNVVYAPIIMTR
ncbi:SLAM family member 5-like [Puntigrus tetrazona]|uniref:SLAM family member 5-like n=1 Tax=Puntigrus tetrazona TaxID=1606681 RepID=UPI001C89DDB3|nr:SLAM family member 5-like [Puntigrus tetrazona]